MIRLIAISLACLMGIGSGVASAQSPSGPEPGTKAPALEAEVCTGDLAGKKLDLVKQRAGKPTVFLFVRADKWDRPMLRYIRGLDLALAKGVEGADGAELVLTWLTEDVDKTRNYLPIAQQSVRFQKATLSVFDGPRTGPMAWEINDAAYLTSVVVRDGRVVERYGFISVGEADVADTLKALAGKGKAKPKSDAKPIKP